MEIIRNQSFDRALLFPLLAPLELKYPAALDWIDNKLHEVENGRAEIWRAQIKGVLAATAFVTYKGAHQNKLSTFIVDRRFQNRGVGSFLLERMKYCWLADDIDRVHVTVDELDEKTNKFFESHAFSSLNGGKVSYGGSRLDNVLLWDRSKLPFTS